MEALTKILEWKLRILGLQELVKAWDYLGLVLVGLIEWDQVMVLGSEEDLMTGWV